jgi:hypothetical protein
MVLGVCSKPDGANQYVAVVVGERPSSDGLSEDVPVEIQHNANDRPKIVLMMLPDQDYSRPIPIHYCQTLHLLEELLNHYHH